jgi:hypothetical protein
VGYQTGIPYPNYNKKNILDKLLSENKLKNFTSYIFHFSQSNPFTNNTSTDVKWYYPKVTLEQSI